MHKDFQKIKSAYQGTKSEIIPILQDIQPRYGYLPEEVMEEVSGFVGVSKSEVSVWPPSIPSSGSLPRNVNTSWCVKGPPVMSAVLIR